MFPIVIIFGDVAMGIDGLRSFYPSVVADHIKPIGLECLGHPIDVFLPAVFGDRAVGNPALLIGNPVFGARTLAGVRAVVSDGSLMNHEKYGKKGKAKEIMEMTHNRSCVGHEN